MGRSQQKRKFQALPTSDHLAKKEKTDQEDHSPQQEEPVSLLSAPAKRSAVSDLDSDAVLVGSPIPTAEARTRWPHRYPSKSNGVVAGTSNGDDGELARRHYKEAIVDGNHFNLGDDVYCKAEDGKPNYIARILELFENTEGEPYFRAQWFYRAEDTVIKDHADLIDSRRVFLSEITDDNPLNCIISKINIAKVSPNVDLVAKEKTIQDCDLYYDMTYKLPHLTFANIVSERPGTPSNVSSTISSDSASNNIVGGGSLGTSDSSKKNEMTLLDLYSGCGAMSTGLCMGADLSGVRLITRWAVDINPHACESLKMNHPETEVRNEAAEDFLSLLIEWKKLCNDFLLLGSHYSTRGDLNPESDEEDNGSPVPKGEFEVGKLLAVCYGDPNKQKKSGLHFKVRWKGYGPSEDTWEPYEGLSKCKERIQDFVTKGYRSNILPLPGKVDFICGGPPCQGVSGFNRFRNKIDPLKDVKNRQLLVFMDIIDFLKPKYILMENVVDILKFAGAFLGRYAIARLVSMNYQARLGMMAAGAYGLPQFRMRVFLWGAHSEQKLPNYPLPTHEAVLKGGVPTEFEELTVAYDESNTYQLEKPLYLGDAISDLPPVLNDETKDEMQYGRASQTEFQKFISLRKQEIVGFVDVKENIQHRVLHDHRPLQLNEDDYGRVCHIPKRKGANFRDLPGVTVGLDNKVQWDPSVERVLLPSGKPLVPDYAMSFVGGKSPKPFGRLWWDHVVGTVVTRAEPHNQVILHPMQDRVLTIRENARLQGFPDCYKLCGPVKERYMQVGNAVAVPVAIALGYTFGQACQGISADDDKPLTRLPFKFPNCLDRKSAAQFQGDGSE